MSKDTAQKDQEIRARLLQSLRNTALFLQDAQFQIVRSFQRQISPNVPHGCAVRLSDLERLCANQKVLADIIAISVEADRWLNSSSVPFGACEVASVVPLPPLK